MTSARVAWCGYRLVGARSNMPRTSRRRSWRCVAVQMPSPKPPRREGSIGSSQERATHPAISPNE